MFVPLERDESTKQYWETILDVAKEKRRERNKVNAILWGNSERLFNKPNIASKEKWIKAIKQNRVTLL